METKRIGALLCLSAVLFSCRKESNPVIKNDALKAGTVSIQSVGFLEKLSYNSDEGVNSLGYCSGDFNGDGFTDIIQPFDEGGKLAVIVYDVSGPTVKKIYRETNIGDAGSVNVGIVAGDVNGDGKADLVQCWNKNGKMSFSVFLSNGATFTRQADQFMSQGSVNLGILPVDVDGDGKTDIAQLWNDGGRMAVIVYHSNGSTFDDWGSTKQVEGVNNVGVIAADYDGDGKTDIIQNWDDGGKLHVIVYKSNGSGYGESSSWKSSQGSGNTGFVPLDYDSDGKMDFAQAWNNGGRANVILYHTNGIDYSEAGNYGLTQGAGVVKWLPLKRSNEKDAFAQIWNNGGKLAFYIYQPQIF
jgi:hypothetical protein